MRGKWLPSTALLLAINSYSANIYRYLFCFHPSTILNKEMKEHSIKKTRVVIMKGSQSTLQSIFMISPLQEPSKSSN